MEEMSGYQDTAYERLSRWTQEKCRLLSSDIYANHDVGKFILSCIFSMLYR